MKRYLPILALLILTGCCHHYCRYEPPVKWLGHPMVSVPGTDLGQWLTNYQVGARQDGMIVWRKMGKDKPQGSHRGPLSK